MEETGQLGYDFSLNDQLTKDQISDLEESGMPTFIINMITPILEIMKYFLTAKNPRWNAVGADGSDAVELPGPALRLGAGVRKGAGGADVDAVAALDADGVIAREAGREPDASIEPAAEEVDGA